MIKLTSAGFGVLNFTATNYCDNYRSISLYAPYKYRNIYYGFNLSTNANNDDEIYTYNSVRSSYDGTPESAYISATVVPPGPGAYTLSLVTTKYNIFDQLGGFTARYDGPIPDCGSGIILGSVKSIFE